MCGEELFFDSTKVKANADTDSLRSRSVAENHLKELFEEADGPEEIEGFAVPHPSPDASAADALPTAADEDLKADNARSKDWVSREGKQEERTFTVRGRARGPPSAR